MKTLASVFLLATLARCADISVCASGCTYTAMQAAIDAARPGDTITLPAGVSLASAPFTLKNKPGADWITIRSSKWNQLPEGYRPAAGDTRLATLAFTTPGVALISFAADPAYSNNCWTTVAVGNVVTFGPLHGGGLTCEARQWDGSLYSSIAPLCTVSLLGNAIPTSGSATDGLRVGLGTDGKCHISHKGDIAETIHFTCTNCVGTGEVERYDDYNFPERTVPIGSIAYSTAGAVTGVGDKRVWLSGPQAAKTDMAGLYPGTFADAYKGPAQGIHHYRFVGIHFRYDSTAINYYGSMFLKGTSSDYRYVVHHLEWDKCVFSQPKASPAFWRWIGLYHGENLLIRNTRFVNATTLAEGSTINMLGSEGPLIMENIETDGGTENVITGGDYMKVAGVPQVILRRSLMRKRLEQNPSLQIVRQTSTGTLALTAINGTTRCNAGTCTAYYEDTPCTFAQDSTITLAAGVSASLYIGVSPTGVLTVGHNSGANVTCAGSFTCLAGITSRAGMAEYAMIAEWTGTSGVWAAGPSWFIFYVPGASYTFNKNLFELKVGKNVLVEGNIFKNYFAAGGQWAAIVLTARNQNGNDVSARLDGFTFARNKVIGAHAGISWAPYDGGGGNTFVGQQWGFTHNIFADISHSRWGSTTAGGTVAVVGGHAMKGASWEHNTADFSTWGFDPNCISATGGWTLNTVLLRNNLWLWQSGASGGVGGCCYVNWNGVHPTSDVPNGCGLVHPNSEYRGNLNLGIGTISSSGWGGTNWADDAGGNFYNNQRVSSVAYSTYLTSISTPAVLTDDFRIKTTSTKSVQNAGYDGPATTDGLDAGADVDWVETLTDGVQEGVPELARRISLSVEPGATGAVVSVTAPDTVTVQVSTHRNMKAASLAYGSSTPSLTEGNRQTFAVSGLAPGTRYWFTVRTAGKVVKGFFLTGVATTIAALDVTLKPQDSRVADAVVEYGGTPSLGSSTAAVACPSGCRVRVPWSGGQLYYRWRYRDGSGSSVAASGVSVASR